MDPTSNSASPDGAVFTPAPWLGQLPGVVIVAVGVVLLGLALWLIHRFDPSRGVLAISVLVVLGFFGALTFAVRFNIPQDPETAALVGGLVAAFGAVVAYWIGGGVRDR